MQRLYIALYALAIAACGSSKNNPEITPAWLAVGKSVERTADRYKVKLEHPVITMGVDDPSRAGLNLQFAESALTHLEQVEDNPIPFDEYAKNFGEESGGQQWVNESIMTIAHHNRSTVTTLCKTYTNTGAVHPNVFRYYEVYDLKTGRRLELSDLLENGKLDAIRAIANVAGDFPNEPAIGLLNNHAVYRPDPDSRMVPEVEIPYAKLKGIIKSQYLP
jgi:hypothetical protein